MSGKMNANQWAKHNRVDQTQLATLVESSGKNENFKRFYKDLASF